MPGELERDINEIKVSMARIEQKLANYEQHFTLLTDYEKRLRELEDFKSRAIGYATALGAVSGLITSLIIKLI